MVIEPFGQPKMQNVRDSGQLVANCSGSIFGRELSDPLESLLIFFSRIFEIFAKKYFRLIEWVQHLKKIWFSILTIILSEGKIIILYSCIELADWQSDEQRHHAANLPPFQFLYIHRPSLASHIHRIRHFG